MRRTTTVAAAAGIAVLSIVGLAGMAHADDTNSVIKAPTTSYTSPSNRSVPVHALQPGDRVDSLCFTEGERVHDSYYWFRIVKDGNTGYVNRDAISAPVDLRHC